MATSQGGGMSNSANVHCCRGLKFVGVDAAAAAVGSLSYVSMDVKLQRDQEGADDIFKRVGIPQKISSITNDDQKVDASPKIDRALLEPNVATFCPSAGTVCVLGQKRYMLTEHTYSGSHNLAQKVKDEFGAGARVAESSDLFQVAAKDRENFARDIGLGSAFVSFEGRTESESGEQFFICSHSGVVSDSYIVPLCDEGEIDEQDEDEDEDWEVNIQANVARVDLCCRANRRLPVLVEVSASQSDSVYSVASASSCSTRLSL